MKKLIYLLLFSTLLLITNNVIGQTYPSDCIVKKYSSVLKQDNPKDMFDLLHYL